jgi:NAD(P)H-hydrate repair Nnr-like enzyme with NAD(P)H-hydrate dehydratase domain
MASAKNRTGPKQVKKLYRPAPDSKKGENGKLLIIGGSQLFHGAPVWAVKIASRIVDLVFYFSIPDLLKAAQKLPVLDFIAVPKKELENYFKEADAVLIGPGLPRTSQTKKTTNNLLRKYPDKKWIIDAGSLQTMDKDLLNKNQLLTPHLGEFERLFKPSAQESKLLKAKETPAPLCPGIGSRYAASLPLSLTRVAPSGRNFDLSGLMRL